MSSGLVPSDVSKNAQEVYVTTTKTRVLLAILVLTCACAFASERTSVWAGIGPKPGPVDLGIIFNTSDLLLDIQGFQGGVGAKFSLEHWMLRGMADLVLGTEFDPFSLSLGAVWEKHLWPGPVSVYWGPAVETGFTTLLLFKVDEDNWSRDSIVPLSLGCVLGIEFFIFDALSVFVEYQAAFEIGIDWTRVSTAGSVSSTAELTYNLDVGMGNNAMFGIVFYLLHKKDPA
jgi:hypothetical protein